MPVGGRTALYQVNVPLLLAIVADEFGVNRVTGEQRIEPFGHPPGLATIRRGEDQQQFLAEVPQRLQVGTGHLAGQVRPVRHEPPVRFHARQRVAAVAALIGAVHQSHG